MRRLLGSFNKTHPPDRIYYLATIQSRNHTKGGKPQVLYNQWSSVFQGWGIGQNPFIWEPLNKAWHTSALKIYYAMKFDCISFIM
jgi:hypothetical protein